MKTLFFPYLLTLSIAIPYLGPLHNHFKDFARSEAGFVHELEHLWETLRDQV